MNTIARILTAALLSGVAFLCAVAGCLAQAKPELASAPIFPEVRVDRDGTVHWGPRTIPFAAFGSPESKKAYALLIESAVDANQPSDQKEFAQWLGAHVQALFAREKATALKIYPVDEQDVKVGGVDAAIYAPKVIPARNRDKVMLEYEVDSTAIAIASVAQVKVIALHYGLTPGVDAHRELVAAYAKLLKTYRPKNVAMFGTSGGCALLHTTLTWLPEQKLPFPGAVGLLTCTGAGDPGDTYTVNNGLDPILSTYLFPPRPIRRPVDLSMPRKAGDPPRTPLEGGIPKGYPPAYLLAGTRDMCLSETVLLHRKLRNAGVEADLNVFEGMWHGFADDTEAPESHEALADLAHFLMAHLSN